MFFDSTCYVQNIVLSIKIKTGNTACNSYQICMHCNHTMCYSTESNTGSYSGHVLSLIQKWVISGSKEDSYKAISFTKRPLIRTQRTALRTFIVWLCGLGVTVSCYKYHSEFPGGSVGI